MRNRLILLVPIAFITIFGLLMLFFFSSSPTPQTATTNNDTPTVAVNDTQQTTSKTNNTQSSSSQELKNVNAEENYPLLVKLRVPYGDSRFAISWREDLQAPWGVVLLAQPKGKTTAQQAIEYTKSYIISRGVAPETLKIEAGVWKE